MNEYEKLDAYFRACNYLSLGQLYLKDNPLLTRPLTLDDVKPNVVGHWGTAPGQNFVYTHLNRIIKKYNLDMIYISGPGHGGPRFDPEKMKEYEAGLKEIMTPEQYEKYETDKQNRPQRQPRPQN